MKFPVLPGLGDSGEGDLHYHKISAREAGILSLLAVIVGLASGLSAIILNLGVHKAIHYLSEWHSTIWMIFIPGVGAALSAIYLRNILKDHSGHGVPDLIRSATLGGGVLRKDMIYSRLISSFLTVSSGGSAGLEGPILTSGGAIGSYIGSLLKFNERRRTLLLGYGAAGAIAAIFNAPMTGTVFALEVILGEWSAMSILPTIISAVTATQFSRIVLGNQVAFIFPSEIKGFHTLDLFVCVFLGLIAGIVSVAFARTLIYSEHKFEGWKIPSWIKAGLGGLTVGLGGYFVPNILHDGYEAIQSFLDGSVTLGLLAIFVFLLMKFFAVIMTLSSGGSGGIFAPSLVLGSALGYGFGAMIQNFIPGVEFASSSAYSLVGMSGMVAGLMHSPLTGMFLVLEITGGYRMILPLMITSVTAMLTSYYFDMGSVYTRGLMKEGYLARKGSDLHLLQTMRTEELIDAESMVIYDDMLLKDFIEVFKNARRNLFPVIDRNSGQWQGVVYLDDIRPYLFETGLYSIMTMSELMHHDLPVIESDEDALSAIEKFESSGAWSLPVIENGKFLGMMSKSTLFDLYRRELIVHTE